MANFLLSKRIDLDRRTKSEGYVSKSPISCKLPLAIPALEFAALFASQRNTLASPGTLPTHSFFFGILLTARLITLVALSYFPVLALGPILERLSTEPRWRTCFGVALHLSGHGGLPSRFTTRHAEADMCGPRTFPTQVPVSV